MHFSFFRDAIALQREKRVGRLERYHHFDSLASVLHTGKYLTPSTSVHVLVLHVLSPPASLSQPSSLQQNSRGCHLWPKLTVVNPLLMSAS